MTRIHVRSLMLGFLFLTAPGLPALGAEYELSIGEIEVTFSGEPATALAVNGQVPGPMLRFTEGEDVVIHVTNTLDVPSSIHWHGLLVPPEMDGVPGISFDGIPPGETFTYRFPLRQAGTYWYHSHSGYQEQQGVYGPLVIDPAGAEPVPYDRDYVIVLSDWLDTDPADVHANLKSMSDYYNYAQRTIGDFFSTVSERGLGGALDDRLMWGEMRMTPTDISDVSGYVFLANGRTTDDAWTGLFTPGERVRLRFINAAAMSYFDVRIPGLDMTVVQADGQDVVPVTIDEFRIAVAETYDVIVQPRADETYTIAAEAMDRTGFALAALSTRADAEVTQPAQRPRGELTMGDMGGDHASMDHGAMDEGSRAAAPMDHAAMGHGNMGHAAMNPAAMDHAAMGHAMPPAAKPAVSRDNEHVPPVGAPPGARVLTYPDLKARTPNDDLRDPEREIVVRLGGNMERYIWTLNGRKFSDAEPMMLRYGERVRLTFINETMMNHPMHLHGMFVELENGEPAETRPRKHIVNVGPGRQYSATITADEAGEWAFHCHLMYHMASGMMNKVVVARLAAENGS